MEEPLAVRDAIILCGKVGIVKVIIKGECASIINWCKFDSSAPPWDVVSILANIKSLESSLDVLFCFVWLGDRPTL